MRRLLAAAVAAISLATIPLAVAPAQDDPAPVATGTGLFEVNCRTPEPFSHRAKDDPIVFPGQPGVSHSHDFIGNRSTDASSTNTSLRKHLTTCVRGDGELRQHLIPRDRAGYWVPTLYVDNEPVKFDIALATYRVGDRQRNIQPFPDDLKMIAGNSKGGAPQDPPSKANIYRWNCPGGYVDRGSLTVVPTCLTPDLRLFVAFPDCWDGHNDDSVDHKSHMAYSFREKGAAADVCPESRPVPVPALTLELHYPTAGGPGVRLASGDASTAHADFMNGWDPEQLQHLIDVCLNADVYCGQGGAG